MTVALGITGLWVAFAASHMLLASTRLRPRLVSALGARAYLLVYSLVAFACFIPLVAVYFSHKHAGPLLWALPISPPLRWVLYVAMGASFVLAVAGLVTPSPATVGAPQASARGVHYLTRHPLFMGVALWGALHLVANGYATDVAFFAGFAVFGVLGCLHQDRRKLATEGESSRAFHAATPFLPFTGRETLRGLRELSPLALVVGVALTVLLRWFHVQLFQ